MVQDGLFAQFPVDAVFGMHNFPGIPLGHFSVRTGPMLASIDTFELKVLSEHNHPATQFTSPDPILLAGRIVEAFHSFKARGINPAEPVIMSITQFQAGDPINDRQGVHITPDHAYVRGTVYTLNDAVRDIMQSQLPAIAEGIASAGGAGCQFSYERGYPVLDQRAAKRRSSRSLRRRRWSALSAGRGRHAAHHGCRGFRLHAQGEAGLLRPDRQWRWRRAHATFTIRSTTSMTTPFRSESATGSRWWRATCRPVDAAEGGGGRRPATLTGWTGQQFAALLAPLRRPSTTRGSWLPSAQPFVTPSIRPLKKSRWAKVKAMMPGATTTT